LRLAARPPVIDDKFLGGALGGNLAQIVGDQRQRQIYTGGDPSR